MKEQIVKPMQRDAPKFKSAAQNYTGIRPETDGIFKKLENLYNGFIVTELNLNDFIRFNNLDMILNNDIIKADGLDFEIVNYAELLEDDITAEKEEVSSELKNINRFEPATIIELLDYYYTGSYNLEELLELPEPEIMGELEDAISERCSDLFYERNAEVYQYFIIPERDAERYWLKYTNYPVFYDYETDIYLLGITHFGMSWDYFQTSYKVRTYI